MVRSDHFVRIFAFVFMKWAFPSGSVLKNLPAIQSLGQEDPLKEEMATHSSILGLGNPMDRETWQVTVHGVAKELDRTE